MSIPKITLLDRQLYAWLGEANDVKFEKAFDAYFRLAFPAVLRHLSRISRWDPAELEELAQDALLRFFNRAGRGRREASESIQNALRQVRPLDCGAFHENQVNSWTRDVSDFRNASMAFSLADIEDADDVPWKSTIHEMAGRITSLQRQGCHLIEAVRVDIGWERTVTTDDVDDLIATSARSFAKQITKEAESGTVRIQTARQKHSELLPFVDATMTVIDAIPNLRVPTNGFLFEIAMTIYLDECKKRGRYKRGGSAFQSSDVTDRRHKDEHPMGSLIDDGEGTGDLERYAGEHRLTADGEPAPFATVVVDPTLHYENEDLFNKFYEYLRRPLAQATVACLDAQRSGNDALARRKLDSLNGKFSRMMTVLSLIGEGYTQEQIAMRLGLSRNQVKYIIELVQESYASFTGESTRQFDLGSLRRRQSHVR